MRSVFHSSLLLLLAASGCAVAPSDPGDVADGFVIEEGKEDNFLSVSGREFVIEGRTTVTIEESLRDAPEEERLARVRELASLKQVGISWFLTQYLIEKEHDAANLNYGGPGHGGLAKANGYEGLDIRQEDGLTYGFTFRQIIAGDPNLISLLTDGTSDEFTLIVGLPTNEELAKLEMNHEWYRQAPWDDFNPETVPAEKKAELRLTISPEEESVNAWFPYAELLEDGVLDIDVHFGWDYHANYHVAHSRALFDWLKRQGFAAPVDRFDQLDHESGAFTRTMRANGEDIRVEVRIFYGKDGTATDPNTDDGGDVLEADMRESFRTRDVVVYSGHSGPFYGFALGNWRRTEHGDLDDSEIAALELPRERQQIVVAEGCDTYHIGEAFKRNPAKPNLSFIDIITTTSSSDASSPAAVQDVISTLTERDESGNHRPRTVRDLLSALDDNSWRFEMYGVHGIDDDPHLHPYAATDMLCEACTRDADCGGAGNRCVAVGTSGRHCAPACTADDGCSDGYGCRAVASGRAVYDRVCAPTSNRCE